MSTNGKSAGPRPDDHVIVLFGATGDLARRKLLPGLFHLHAAGLLPREYRVIGSAPASFALTGGQFRAHAADAVEKFGLTRPDDPSWPGQEARRTASGDPDGRVQVPRNGSIFRQGSMTVADRPAVDRAGRGQGG